MIIKFRQSVLIIALLICLGCTHTTADSAKDDIRTFHGTLQVMIADDFKDNSAQAVYHLISADGGAVLRLNFTNMHPAPVLKTGTLVAIEGRRHGDRLDVVSLRILPSEKN